MQRQIETRNFLAVYFAVSSQNGESPLRDEYQRPEQSRATVPRKKKSAWPKSMPGRLSALMYSAAPKYRLGRSPKKCLPSLALGRALPASAPRGLLPPAPYASAHGAGRYSTKRAAPERCPARKPGGEAPRARKQREVTTRAKDLEKRKNAAKLVYRGNYAPSRGDRHGGEKITTDASGRPA